MDFRQAWFAMLNGKKVRPPYWDGYWEWRHNTIMLNTGDGEAYDIRKENAAYIFSHIIETDWEIVE